MKAKLLIILSILIVYSCKKKCTESRVNLNGKIKRIIEIDSFPSHTNLYEFTFLYDSLNGLLKTVLLDSQSFVTLDYSTPNKILLKYNRSLIGFSPSIATINAYIDNNNYINRLTLTDSLHPTEKDNLLIYNNTNHQPDSIREYTFPAFYDYSIYSNFEYSQNNITNYIHRYSSFFTGDRIDTITNYFSNYDFKKLPLQANSIGVFAVGYITFATDPLFLLSINDNYAYTTCINLLDSFRNNSYIIYYYYTFDHLQKVVGIRRIYEQNVINFKINYY